MGMLTLFSVDEILQIKYEKWFINFRDYQFKEEMALP